MVGIPARNALAAIPCPIVPTPITATGSLGLVIDRSCLDAGLAPTKVVS